MNEPNIVVAHTHGFTLIELLVVVTIIVVLLAMLVPALDKAIYAAEMAVDAAQMRGVAHGTLLYAMNHQRSYPGPGPTWDAMNIRNASAWNIPGLLESYVSIKSFSDPFLEQANLRTDECMKDPYGVYMPGYHWYPNWGTAAANLVPMRRLGQKMVFTAWAPENDVRSFRVILADRDARQPGAWATTSHPDKDGLQTLRGYQEGGNPWIAQGLGPAIGPATGNVYFAWWEGASRGKTDLNYALDDGSVLRLDDVPQMFTLQDDTRLTFLPDVMDTSYTTDRRTQLPKAN